MFLEDPQKILIKTARTGAFNLQSVTASPRTVTPIDVQSACSNVALEFANETPPSDTVVSVVNYLLTEYFATSHSSGLYNRQKQLWESLAKAVEVVCTRLITGFWKRVDEPFVDMLFRDSRGIALLYARVVEQPVTEGKAKEILNTLLKRAAKLQSKNALTGVVLVFPQPFPESVLNRVKTLINAEDPVARFESKLTDLGLTVILMEIDLADNSLKLLQPDLSKKK